MAGIKSDRWIRRMALEHRMIEPFEEKQVRDGVISYGVSSYGYDIRVADEFKIFTNVNTTVVDPKNFDQRSLVDYRGDICVVPPNSFALARTVEYFRIPRNVLTVCLGKCLTGDTRVVDAETGDYLPLETFISRRASNTVALSDWKLASREVSAHTHSGTQPVYELTTRAGLKVKATATHPFRTLSGWMPLGALRAGDRIAAARSCPVFGKDDWPEHEALLLGLMLSDGQCHTPGSSPRFTSEDPRLVDVVSTAARDFGCDVPPFFYSWLERLGCNVGSAGKFVPSVVFRARRERVATFLQALFSGDGSVYSSGDSVVLEYSSISERLAYDVRHLLLRFGVFALVRRKALPGGGDAWRVQVTDKSMIERFAERIGFIPGSRKQAVLDEMVVRIAQAPAEKSNFDTLPSSAWSLIKDLAHGAGYSLRSLGVERTQPGPSLPYGVARQVALVAEKSELAAVGACRRILLRTPRPEGPSPSSGRSAPYSRTQEVRSVRCSRPSLDLDPHAGRPLNEGFSDMLLADSDVVWDTVESIVAAGLEPVYDLTVPDDHNFLANDMIVHNSTYARCGIICNVTPFEPEWEGYATLEISNTTPLPARIYANEGIAQVIFFESDEVCETSYADKKGKYQSQVHITLPRL